MNAQYLKGEVDTPNEAMVEVFAWASITTAASMFGTLLGYTICAPLMRNLTDSFCAALLSYVVLPLGAHLILRSVSSSNIFSRSLFFDENNSVERI